MDDVPSPQDPSLPPNQASRAGSGPDPGARLWILGILAGLLAGAAAAGAGEALFGSFDPHLQPVGALASPKEHEEHGAKIRVIERRETALATGLTGGILGLFLGMAGGLARRSAGRAIGAGLTGLVLGAGAGAASAMLAMPYYLTHRDVFTDDPVPHFLLHCMLWLPLGAAAGLALAIGFSGWRTALRGLLGGLIGAALGTLIYEFVGLMLFPLAASHRPLPPRWEVRSLARVVVSLCVAIIAVLSVASASPRRAELGPRSGPES